ncbi:MAG: DUF2461 domain-containing protein [Cyclobacteriaceae bacterium]|nr:DUF2461 domain-containing protein [Cyclobacteriaceae bacterium]
MDAQLILKFLQSLSRNNNREWFEKNKEKYLAAKAEFDGFVANLLNDLIDVDPALAGLNPKKLSFRIYRDVRFSKDKRPYKTNMGATFSAGGKLMQKPGFYLHLEPGGKSFLAAGLYMPEPESLSKVRQEIDYNGEQLDKVLKGKKFRTLFGDLEDFDKLKTVPKGYSKEHPYAERLKLKSFIASATFTDAQVTASGFRRKVVEAAAVIKPLNDFLDQAIA